MVGALSEFAQLIVNPRSDPCPRLDGLCPRPPSATPPSVDSVASVFETAEDQQWDQRFYPLSTRGEVRAHWRHNQIPAERADTVEIWLWLTKRGVLVGACTFSVGSGDMYVGDIGPQIE